MPNSLGAPVTESHSYEIIAPLSNRKETRWLFFLIILLLLLALLRYWQLRVTEKSLVLSPYQRISNDLEVRYDPMYRALVAAEFDVAFLRNQQGIWPESFLLQQEGIPPFSNTTLPSALKNYTWLSFDHGSWVDYLGQSDNEDMTFILRIIDLHSGYHPHPHPGVDYDPQIHTAAQVWTFNKKNQSYPGEKLPEAGWMWVISPNNPLIQRRNQTLSVLSNE